MKGKATWKPSGLHAKKWREASQSRAPANLLPPVRRGKDKPLWKKDLTQGPGREPGMPR